MDTLKLAPRRLTWRELSDRILPRCSHADCTRGRSLGKLLRGGPARILVQGSWVCAGDCLEPALLAAMRQLLRAPLAHPHHRVPLGLLLLSRQRLTEEQLRAGLAAQRAAGHGKIGEWLKALGFVGESEVTAALARQWSCPVLRAESSRPPRACSTLQLPAALLESFAMAPVEFVEASRTLHIAFGEGVDYGVLYAIEQMAECRAQACMAAPSLLEEYVREYRRALSAARGENEVVFAGAADTAERARIVRSYAGRVSASSIRMARCGSQLWARLFRPSRPPLDLVLGASSQEVGQQASR